MKNFFEEEYTLDEQTIELYKFLKKHFQFCDIEYIKNDESTIGFHFDNLRYYVKCDVNYNIYDFQRCEYNCFLLDLDSVKNYFIRKIGEIKYTSMLMYIREKKLKRILDENS